jgi:hypothetical protein
LICSSKPFFVRLSLGPLAPNDGANAPKVIAAQHWRVVKHRADLNILPTRIAQHFTGSPDGEGPRLEHAHRRCAVAQVGHVPHDLRGAVLAYTLSAPASLLDASRETLKAIRQRSKLVSAAEIESEPVGYPSERIRDAAEVLDPRLKRPLVHRAAPVWLQPELTIPTHDGSLLVGSGETARGPLLSG